MPERNRASSVDGGGSCAGNRLHSTRRWPKEGRLTPSRQDSVWCSDSGCIAAAGIDSAEGTMAGAGCPVHAPQVCGPTAASAPCVRGRRANSALKSETCCRCPQRVQRTGHCSRHICGRSMKRGRERRKPGLPQNKHVRRRPLPPTMGRSSYACTRCFSPTGSFDVTPMCGLGERLGMSTSYATTACAASSSTT